MVAESQKEQGLFNLSELSPTCTVVAQWQPQGRHGGGVHQIPDAAMKGAPRDWWADQSHPPEQPLRRIKEGSLTRAHNLLNSGPRRGSEGRGAWTLF